MESDQEKTPTDTGQDEENINSEASVRSGDGHEDAQQACEQPSFATSSCCESLENLDKAIDELTEMGILDGG